jgi:hypothetical protein
VAEVAEEASTEDLLPEVGLQEEEPAEVEMCSLRGAERGIIQLEGESRTTLLSKT